MKLKAFLSQAKGQDGEIEVSGISLDSQSISAGVVFFALNGARRHGMEFANQALEKGAVAIVYDPEGMRSSLPKTQLPVFAVENLAAELGNIAAAFYGDPSAAIPVIGVTGTNGKTTCSQFLAQVLPDSGVIGTLGWGEWGDLQQTWNTTPDALQIQSIFAEFVQQQKKYAVMEVSSHGLHQGRVNGTQFYGAVFTNISRDHLDYHGTMEAYVQAKLRLAALPDLRFLIVNVDDQRQQQIIAQAHQDCAIWGYSFKQQKHEKARMLYASNISYSLNGIRCDVNFERQCAALALSIFGDFNLHNVLAVLATLLAIGEGLANAVAKLSKLKTIVGRMEPVQVTAEQPLVFIDYAHTPDALEKVLRALSKHKQHKIWLVFGCGGDRDRGKRALMGQVAVTGADEIVLTDDNPRLEDGGQIIDDIIQGCGDSRFYIVRDRATAIDMVISKASNDDVVLIAGKGHEPYQDIGGKKIPYSDRAVAEQSLIQRCA